MPGPGPGPGIFFFKKNNKKINPKDQDRIIFLRANENNIKEYIIDIDDDGGSPIVTPYIENEYDNHGGKKTKRKIKKSRKKSLKKKSRKMKKTLNN